MTNYTKSTDFAVKDVLLTGNPNKLVKGSEVDVEFSNMELADATNVKKTGSTGSAVMPVGTTAQRDASPAVGYTRVNTTSGTLEWWDGTIWTSANGGDAYDLEVTTATAGQTVITTASSFVVGSHTLMVYLNGLLVNKTSDYTETTTNSFTFNSGLTAGDEVVAQIWRTNIATSGDALTVSYTPAGTGAVATTVQAKLRESVSVKDFGAVGDGVTDDTVAIQAAFTYAATLGHCKVEFPYGSSFKCNSGLTIDTNKVKVNGNGSYIDFSGMTTGDAIAITQSHADGNMRNALNHTNPIDGLVLVGPGLATTAVRCVNINDASGLNISSGVTFNNCAFINFAKDVNFGNGAFCCTFNKCNFTILTGTATTYSVEMLSAALNAGERNRFVDCMWNNRDFVYNQTSGNANAFFDDCSFDYSPTRVMTVTGGAVYINGGHIEQSSDAGYYFYVSGTNSLIQIADVDIIHQAAKTAFAPFYSDSTATQGGISIRDCRINQVGSFTTKLVDGAGRTAVDNIVFQAAASKPALSSWQNYLAYGGFESANYTAEWTLSTAVRSTTQARSGTYSLSFPASSGVTPSASMTMPVKPGQTVLGELWYLVPSITGTSGTFYIQIDWLDKGSNSLGSSAQLTQTTNVAAWTRLPLYFAGTAPAGTANYKLSISLFGVASGTPTGYIDDVILAAV